MEKFVKRMIDEHRELVCRIENLHNFVYSDASNSINRIEFANMCIQLSAMKKYEEALNARLVNQGIFFENGQYFERVSAIDNNITPPAIETKGSDHDVDNE